MANMKLIALIALLVSCGQQQVSPPSAQDTMITATDTVAVSASNALNNLNIQTGSFQEIGKTGVVMFPLSVGETERTEGTESLYRSSPNNSIWNIVFYNAITGETKMLGERKMLISSFSPVGDLSSAAEADSLHKYIYYRVRVDDVNNDKQLTDKDPEYLFISDLKGEGFRQISPAGLHLQSWGLVKTANKVIMIVHRDSDKNGAFTQKDEELIYQIDPSKEKDPHEIFPDALKNKLKMMFNRDWKKEKD
jgi:hypothetical protein